MNMQFRPMEWWSRSAMTKADAWSAPYRAKQTETFMAKCSLVIAISKTPKQASIRKCSG
jgi:hypothetical protein